MTTGEIIYKDIKFVSKFERMATVNNLSYSLATFCPGGCPIIRSHLTNKSWTVDWETLLQMAIEAGIDKEKLKVTKADIGRWVEYLPKKEYGRIKAFNDTLVFVVYHCDDNWSNYQDYTAAGARYEDLRFLDSNEIPHRKCTDIPLETR